MNTYSIASILQKTEVQFKENLLPEPLSDLYLAKGLVDDVPSQVEGLFKRYPLIWNKRKKGTLHNSAILLDNDFKKSFLKLYLYHFLLEAKQDSSLRCEITQLLKKVCPNFYKQLKQQKRFVPARLLNEWLVTPPGIQIPYNAFFTQLAYLEWLAKANNLSFELDSSYQNFYTDNLDIILETKDLTIEGHSFNKMKRFPFLIEQSLKQFEENKKTKFSRYCEQVWEAITDTKELTDDYYSLSLYTSTFLQNTPRQLCFSSDAALKIFTHALSHWFEYLSPEKQTPILNQKQIKLAKGDFDELEKNIPFAIIQLLISKQIRENRVQFFDSIQTHDIHLAQKLKIENKQLKQTVSTTQKEQKKLIQEKEELKKTINTQIKKATEKEHSLNRELERTLKRTQSEKERLESELERMKKELQQLKEENQTLKENIQFLSSEDENHDESTIELDFINQPSTLFIGGFPTVVNRLKERMPHCKYFECGMKVKDEFFNGVERAYIMTRYVDHGMVYQAEKNLPNALIKGISTTNLSRIFEQLG